MLFGDVLAVITGFIALTLTTWAALLAAGLMFDAKVHRAHTKLQSGFWAPMLHGVGILLVLGGLGLALLNAPSPGVKFLGAALIGALLAIGTVGGAGLSRLVAIRMREQHTDMSEFTAFSRSSLILVGVGLLPVLGWFLFLPALLCIAFGAGWSALLGKQRVEALEPTPLQ
ncbi:hypothetical protein MCEMSE15_02755 [Fimbriimonadaceae bacterium]